MILIPPGHRDLIGEARSVAVAIEQTAAALMRTRDPAIKEAAGPIGEAGKRLAEQLRDFVRDLTAITRRKLGGFIVGFEHHGATWYVSHASNLGSIVRTPDAEYARLHKTQEEAVDYLADMGRSHGQDAAGKPWPAPISQLAGKELALYRVSVVVKPAGRLFKIPDHGMGPK